MEFCTAENLPLEALLAAENDAFSDYVTGGDPISMPAFEGMLHQRGFDASLTWVAVEGSEVAACWIVGAEPETRPGVSYGLSVGTRPGHRRKGLARQLWNHMASHLRERGFDSQVLEVIEMNLPAIPLYESLGFVKQRRVECFKGPAPASDRAAAFRFKNLPVKDAVALGDSFRDWQPTWQNSAKAAMNLGEEIAATVVCSDETPIGYGLFHKPYGQVVQLAVNPADRRKGVGRALLAHWRQAFGNKDMVVLNVPDTDQASLDFFRCLGWGNHVNQFEMAIRL